MCPNGISLGINYKIFGVLFHLYNLTGNPCHAEYFNVLHSSPMFILL